MSLVNIAWLLANNRSYADRPTGAKLDVRLALPSTFMERDLTLFTTR